MKATAACGCNLELLLCVLQAVFSTAFKEGYFNTPDPGLHVQYNNKRKHQVGKHETL